MKHLSTIVIVLAAAVAGAQGATPPVTLYEDNGSSLFGDTAYTTTDTPYSGSSAWRVEHSPWGTNAFLMFDGQASISDVISNDVSLWYRDRSSLEGSVMFTVATAAPQGFTDDIIVTLTNDGQWHELVLDFSDNGSGLDPDVDRTLCMVAQNWLTTGTGSSHARTVDYDFVRVVPEPASLSLLGLGGLAAIARRRRHA